MMLKRFLAAVVILFAGISLFAAATPRSFRIHHRDVIQWSLDGRPYLLRCPTCAYPARSFGTDPYTGRPIYCPTCGGNACADARVTGLRFIVVPDDEPSDYAINP